MKKKTLITGLALTTVSGLIGGLTATYLHKETPISQKNAEYVSPIRAGFAEGNVDFTKAAELSIHSVVHIKTKYATQAFMDPIQQFFYGGAPQAQTEQIATGSGVVITDDGYIATNNHVIDNADEIEVTLNDKRTFKAKVVGNDPQTDLALLKIESKGLPFLRYGDSEVIKVGEWVLAVGNPFNLTSTVTAGIVSAKGRNISVPGDPRNNPYAIESFIQTDAAVNRGNSGGALVNTRGELIGINSAIASTTGVYAGYSFAIPVSIVKKVMDDLLEYGEVQRALMGINIAEVNDQIAKEKGLKDVKGVLIGSINPSGAAKEAGLIAGDVVTRIGTVEVNSAAELQEQVSKYRPGDKISITYVRDGKEKIATVTLKNQAGNTALIKKSSESLINLLGAEFESAPKAELNRLGLNSGVKVRKLDSGKLRGTGIREGFIITSIDNKNISSTNDLTNALSNKKGGILIEGYYPNGVRGYYAFGLQ